ncbi:membrane protein required for colicin V production [Porphyrobacter sp. MBR-155]|jgi:membrane protein required for colicin V production|uniref:CvpA family protein n=1 Tax=Porphyrobacter sp. MBR-155 TaxID=3156464 RepID=UPI001D8DE416|nr:CvpA family protein [Alphaproteobacteria bacterium]
MTGFDIIILIIIGVAAVGGFMRGLVQEVLSLASWIMAAVALHFMHPVLTDGLRNVYSAEPTTPLLAFVLLLLIPYAAMKVIIGTASGASDGAILGPIDRVLGFGFGAIKGVLIAIFAFSLLAIGFDDSWGYKGRPTWITTARTYPAADTFSRDLLPMIAVRRDELRRESEAQEAAAAKAAG